MPRPRVVEEEGGVVDPAPGEEVPVGEGEAPIITTLVRGTATEGELAAIQTTVEVLGVAGTEGAEGEEEGQAVMEDSLKAMGKQQKPL